MSARRITARCRPKYSGNSLLFHLVTHSTPPTRLLWYRPSPALLGTREAEDNLYRYHDLGLETAKIRARRDLPTPLTTDKDAKTSADKKAHTSSTRLTSQQAGKVDRESSAARKSAEATKAPKASIQPPLPKSHVTAPDGTQAERHNAPRSFSEKDVNSSKSPFPTSKGALAAAKPSKHSVPSSTDSAGNRAGATAAAAAGVGAALTSMPRTRTKGLAGEPKASTEAPEPFSRSKGRQPALAEKGKLADDGLPSASKAITKAPPTVGKPVSSEGKAKNPSSSALTASQSKVSPSSATPMRLSGSVVEASETKKESLSAAASAAKTTSSSSPTKQKPVFNTDATSQQAKSRSKNASPVTKEIELATNKIGHNGDNKISEPLQPPVKPASSSKSASSGRSNDDTSPDLVKAVHLDRPPAMTGNSTKSDALGHVFGTSGGPEDRKLSDVRPVTDPSIQETKSALTDVKTGSGHVSKQGNLPSSPSRTDQPSITESRAKDSITRPANSEDKGSLITSSKLEVKPPFSEQPTKASPNAALTSPQAASTDSTRQSAPRPLNTAHGGDESNPVKTKSSTTDKTSSSTPTADAPGLRGPPTGGTHQTSPKTSQSDLHRAPSGTSGTAPTSSSSIQRKNPASPAAANVTSTDQQVAKRQSAQAPPASRSSKPSIEGASRNTRETGGLSDATKLAHKRLPDEQNASESSSNKSDSLSTATPQPVKQTSASKTGETGASASKTGETGAATAKTDDILDTVKSSLRSAGDGKASKITDKSTDSSHSQSVGPKLDLSKDKSGVQERQMNGLSTNAATSTKAGANLGQNTRSDSESSTVSLVNAGKGQTAASSASASDSSTQASHDLMKSIELRVNDAKSLSTLGKGKRWTATEKNRILQELVEEGSKSIDWSRLREKEMKHGPPDTGALVNRSSAALSRKANDLKADLDKIARFDDAP